MRTLVLLAVALPALGCGGGAQTLPDAGIPACVRDRGAPDGITVDTEDPRMMIIRDFPSTHLDHTRAIRVYLPPGYQDAPGRSYPVIYMHDGQNLFDPATATWGNEWQVDETVDTLVGQGRIPPVIVVGIDSTEARIDEYTMTEDPDYSDPNGYQGGKGSMYAAFLLEEVKPYIDSTLRTRCGPDSTALIGSSLGANISLGIARNHPEVFGMVGMVSPALWWNDRALITELEQAGPDSVPPARIWIDAGTREEADDRDQDGLIDLMDDMRAARERLLALGYTFGADLGGLEVEGALHNEQSWAERFVHVLLYFFASSPEPAVTALAVDTYGDRVALQGPDRLQRLHVNVIATYDNGMRMTVPSSLVTFEVADTGVATMDSGVLRSVAAGTTTVTASYAGVTSPPASIEVIDALPETVRVTFEVTIPDSTPADKTVTLAGTMNSWAPSATSYPLEQVDATHWTGSYDFDFGVAHQFKLTLQPQDSDPWHMVEKDADCQEIDNRELTPEADATYPITVASWRNNDPCGD